MTKVFAENKFLFITWGVLLFSGLMACAVYEKAAIHLLFNGFHTTFLDHFMLLITNLGDGIVMVVIALLMLLKKIRYFLIFIFSFLSSSIVVQLLKRLVFPGFPRPVKFFEATEHSLYLIPGIKYYSYFSFPSGHATTAFALFIGLALIVENQVLKFVFLAMACVIAFSRVYLSQHFLIDILAGSIIGVLCAVIAHIWFSGMNKKYLDLPVYKVLSIK